MPKLLDLFCGMGGAADGYVQAGWDVTGVDITPQPFYPYRFIQEDVLSLDSEWIAANFDGVHASPPCQAHSDLRHRTGKEYPDLIPATRNLLRATGLPYVIENVEGAPLIDPIMLCGTMFPGLRVIRHRLFESNVLLEAPPHKLPHPLCHTLDQRKLHYGTTDEWLDFVSVNGGGNCSVASAQQAMQIPRGRKADLNEAIPPMYTVCVGSQLLYRLPLYL